MDANLNVTVSNPKIIINDFEVEDEYKFKNTNIESGEDTETLDLTKESVNYNNVMNILGLNAEINYPIRVLVDAIIELHLVINTNQKLNMKYGRIYDFRKNKLSTLLKNNLFSGTSMNYGISYYDVKNRLKQLIRTHKYNIITDSINILNNAGLAKPIKEVIGFNFNNPRWVALYDYNI